MFTTDTRKIHCPIRIMYSQHRVGPIHTTSLTDRIYLQRDMPLAIIKATEHSDYAGGPVERSNYRVILGDCREGAHRPGIIQICGSHGYQALAYDATLGPVPGDDDLCEILEGLEGYCAVDDDDVSNLESELETEAWEDWGRHEFAAELPGLFDALCPGLEHGVPSTDYNVSDSDIDALWREGCEVLNIHGGYKIETGGGVYFYISGWCEEASRDRKAAPAWRQGQRLDALLERILHMAAACRIRKVSAGDE